MDYHTSTTLISCLCWQSQTLVRALLNKDRVWRNLCNAIDLCRQGTIEVQPAANNTEFSFASSMVISKYQTLLLYDLTVSHCENKPPVIALTLATLQGLAAYAPSRHSGCVSFIRTSSCLAVLHAPESHSKIGGA